MATKHYANATLPGYTYVLRAWLKEDGDEWGTQSQVLVVRSDIPLLPHELKAQVETLHDNFAKFHLVDLPRNSVATLDTWEQGIEYCTASEMEDDEIPLVSNWWVE